MKIKVDLITGIILELISIVALVLPIFNIRDVLGILKFILISYSIVSLGRFILNFKTKDYEGLYTGLTSFVLFVFLFYVKTSSALSYALLVFTFVIAQSFIRLKKADYYHDQKNKMWILEITTLIIFIISGLLTSLNLLISTENNSAMVGFLFFINGFIELIDPIVNYIKNN